MRTLGFRFADFVGDSRQIEVKPNREFLKQPRVFWANVRTISQEVGYTETAEGYWKVPPGLTVPLPSKSRVDRERIRVLACDHVPG